MKNNKLKEILKFWKKEEGVKKVYAFVGGKLKIKYRSRVIIEEKLITKYFPSWIKAKAYYNKAKNITEKSKNNLHKIEFYKKYKDLKIDEVA